jgi:hypothetical protein
MRTPARDRSRREVPFQLFRNQELPGPGRAGADAEPAWIVERTPAAREKASCP